MQINQTYDVAFRLSLLPFLLFSGPLPVSKPGSQKMLLKGAKKGVLGATVGYTSHLKLQIQSGTRLNAFQPGWASASHTGSHHSEGDKYNLDVVVKSSQGSKHMVHTNCWHLREKKTEILSVIMM